jgi:hypothetical protein
MGLSGRFVRAARSSAVVPGRRGAVDQSRWAFLLNALAVAGAVVCAGQLVQWSLLGAWPFHDTAAYWLAGRHLLEGAPVYYPGSYLAFLYAPPLAVLAMPLSLLPLDAATAALFGGQVLALRYIAGSWRAAGLVSWLPFVPRELVTGNVDLLMAAAILAGVRGRSGWAIGLFAVAKFSPALVISRRTFHDAALMVAVLVALSLPWWHLWPEWIATLRTAESQAWLPIAPRLVIALGLLALRRPWATALAAGIATPAFHEHSFVLLLPAARLLWDQGVAHDGRPPATVST